MQVCRKRSACFSIASSTPGERWPMLMQPMPPAKSRNRFPSTSSSIAPSARATYTGVACESPRGTAASRRSPSARDLVPGMEVFSLIVGISVPPDRLFVQIDVHLLGLEILFDAQGRSEEHTSELQSRGH